MLKKLTDKISRHYYLTYTVLFVLLSMVLFSYFYLSGKTFISTVDGVSQYYKALIWYHRQLLAIGRNLIQGKGLILPQWDFHMGEGNDVLAALYYTIGDPIAALVVFVPERYISHFYDLSIVLRIYLSGLCFSFLCAYTGKKDFFARLASGFVYDFCYWMLLSQSKDIYFLNPMIDLPLVILGVEMILREKKPVLFTLAVFLSAITNFYFFFMIAILTVFYVLLRLICLYRTDVKKMIKPLLGIALHAILGTALAAVTVFPVAYALLSNNRLSVDYGLHGFYPIIYYERLMNVFLSKDDPFWLCMGFASPCLLAVGLTFRKARKDVFLFLLNLVTVLLICLPVCGKILNGFSYVSNRWSFAIALVCAYDLCVQWEDLKQYRFFQLCLLFACFLWSFAFPMSREVRILIPIGIALFFYAVAQLEIPPFAGIDLKPWLMLGLVLLGILYNADYVYSYRGRQRTNVVISREEAINIQRDNEAHILQEAVNDTDFYRYSGSDLTNNVAILNGTYATSYYFSIANPAISDYRSDLGVNEYLNFLYKEYDARAMLNSLASVRYYLSP